MLDIIRQLIKGSKDDVTSINIIREFLQILILKILYDKNAYKNIAFIGGTALRILYDLKRFSEDIDFSLVNSDGYDFKSLLELLKSELILHNFDFDIKYKQGVIDNCFIRFRKILQEFHLDKHREEKISIKIEIDTNPPLGANTENVMINNQFIFDVKTFDQSSLMAGKCHAILCRGFYKGRDFYDLMWYLSKKIVPNFILLNNAIKQTEHEDWNLQIDTWKKFMLDKMNDIDFQVIRKDVVNFLEYQNEVNMININTFNLLLKH